MSVSSPPAPIPVPTRSGHDYHGSGSSSSIRSAPVVEQFYEKHHSFKANKAPAIDREEMKEVFDHFDENHDGQISKDDLRHFMSRLGIPTTEEEISSMVNSVDADGDGSVDFEEFASLYQMVANDEIPGNGDEDEDLKEAFRVFDKNADGFISLNELQDVLVKLGMEEGQSLSNCQRIIQNVDLDGDGRVDFGEFKHMMSGDGERSDEEKNVGSYVEKMSKAAGPS